jgi:hypothetical protein
LEIVASAGRNAGVMLRIGSSKGIRQQLIDYPVLLEDVRWYRLGPTD